MDRLIKEKENNQLQPQRHQRNGQEITIIIWIHLGISGNVHHQQVQVCVCMCLCTSVGRQSKRNTNLQLKFPSPVRELKWTSVSCFSPSSPFIQLHRQENLIKQSLQITKPNTPLLLLLHLSGFLLSQRTHSVYTDKRRFIIKIIVIFQTMGYLFKTSKKM